MKGASGYTVIELLVASAVMLLVAAATTSLLHDALLRTPVLEEATDVHQRARVAIDALSRELRAAASGTRAGPLLQFFAAVLPRHAGSPATVALPDVITVRYAVPGGASATLAVPLAPADTVALLDPGGSCVRNAVACGFTTGTRAVVFDRTGQADALTIDGIGPASLALGTAPASRTMTYSAGSIVAEFVEVTFFVDRLARQLRREENGVSFPFVENVTDLRFEYLGTTSAPSLPRPDEGVANCLYSEDGVPLLPPAVVAGDSLVPIALETLADGPYCASGRMMFDADLLRVRGLRALVRLETPVDALRGIDPRLFARPGTASGTRTIPDVLATIDVALRNTGR